MTFFEKRRARRQVEESLRHARHFRNMRVDLLTDAEKGRLAEADAAVRDAWKAQDAAASRAACDRLLACIVELTPHRAWPAFSENLEVLVVAIAVAMAFRTYFLQPFKIPTGSMQPSLYGITSEFRASPTLGDRWPLKALTWLVYGRNYRDVRIAAAGYLDGPYLAGADDPSIVYYFVGAKRYAVPKDAVDRREVPLRSGAFVQRGDRLWSGIVKAGDHVFVDRVRWNVLRPRRGDVTVFATAEIPTLPPGTHYIKRLVGLPEERISIRPPQLLVDGEPVTSPPSILRIERREAGYKAGYVLGMGPDAQALSKPDDEIALGADRYFLLGDNTTNSRDGRYWGSVPQRNLVGPAMLVYWPFSDRWGRVR